MNKASLLAGVILLLNLTVDAQIFSITKDINEITSTVNSGARNVANINGILYFSSYQIATGYELWKSDGTTAGTTLVKDLYPGNASGNPSKFINVNGTLFFVGA